MARRTRSSRSAAGWSPSTTTPTTPTGPACSYGRTASTAFAEVRHAPLTELTADDRTYQWYDVDRLTDLRGIDLLVIDGPPAATGPDARYPALQVLEAKLAPTATVVLDDANRPDEQDAVRRWTENVTGSDQRAAADRAARGDGVLPYRISRFCLRWTESDRPACGGMPAGLRGERVSLYGARQRLPKSWV